jgi:glycosyltransferase involved in cell wall biosynthesis
LIREIICVDGGSTDKSLEILEKSNVVLKKSDIARRSVQMNVGARSARGSILYFVHADTLPPGKFSVSIIEALQGGFNAGCFRSLFNTDNIFLKINSYFTRFPGLIFRGGGQSLFIEKELFMKLGEYNEEMRIMEEYDLIRKVKKITRFKIIQEDILVSARDYEREGSFWLQFRYSLIYLLYFSRSPYRWVEKAYEFLCRRNLSRTN